MLQYSIYSVISPEGCASILWKTSDKAQEAADAMGITAHRLKALGLIDKIVNEPVGGAHRDTRQMGAFLKRALNDAWRQLSDLRTRELLDRRYERLQSYGRFTDTKADAPLGPPRQASDGPLVRDRAGPLPRAGYVVPSYRLDAQWVSRMQQALATLIDDNPGRASRETRQRPYRGPERRRRARCQ
jgi:hypothetical protein